MVDRLRSPANTADQATNIDQAWPQIGQGVTLGGVTREGFQGGMTTLQTAEENLASAEAVLTDARNQRKAARHELWELVKRVRSGAKAQFGDDSNEYELVGGTRLSERK